MNWFVNFRELVLCVVYLWRGFIYIIDNSKRNGDNDE